MSDTPIQVNASAVLPIAMSILRHALTLAGGILVSKGFLDQGTADQAVEQVAGLLLALAPPIWAAVRAKLTHDKLVTTAEAAPDSVAFVNK